MSAFRQPITKLSTDQKQKLVNALLKCQNVADRYSRDAIVRELPEDIKNNIKHNDTDRVDVVNIVTTALAYGNGLEEFIKLVELYEGNSSGMQAVHEVHLRAQLVSIAQETNIDPRVFASVFHGWRILPSDCLLPFDAPEVFVEMLWDLNGSVRRWRLLIEFVARLSGQINKIGSSAKAVEQLQQWAKHAFSIVGNELEFATLDELATAVDKQKEQVDERPTYLTVEITPDFVDPTHVTSKFYQVQILFWRGDEQESTWRTGDEPAVTLPNIPDEIAKTLRENISEWEDHKVELIVEFLLPNELLLCDVDQWENKLKQTKGARLGMEYPILVRSLQRIKMRESWRNWRHKWAAFNQHAHQQRLLHAFWLCVCEESDWQMFQAHSRLQCIEYTFRLRSTDENWQISLHNRLISITSATCLGMIFAPTEKPKEDDELFTALIESGIPMAFWLRPSRHASESPTQIQTRLQQIFGDYPLKKLPQALRDARQQSVDDSTLDICNHLTLLWDDPDRIPAQYKDKPRTKNKRRLRAPQPSQPGRRVSS